MGVARGRRIVELGPAEAFALWTDHRRWPTFVEGFARLERVDAGWPERGAKLVWQSIPGGRGRVTEKVAEHAPELGRFSTDVFEEALTGRQTARFSEQPGEGTLVELELDYRLTRAGVVRQVADVFFIRRALSDALARTLRRFATEAAEEAAL